MRRPNSTYNNNSNDNNNNIDINNNIDGNENSQVLSLYERWQFTTTTTTTTLDDVNQMRDGMSRDAKEAAKEC